MNAARHSVGIHLQVARTLEVAERRDFNAYAFLNSLVQSPYAIGGEIAFVFGADGGLVRLNCLEHTLIDFRADQHFAGLRAAAIARRAVDRVADDRELKLLRRADETVQHFAAMDTDADFANHFAARGASGASVFGSHAASSFFTAPCSAWPARLIHSFGSCRRSYNSSDPSA